MGQNFAVVWNEDNDATVLARLTARDGSGAATGVNGEGNWLQQADISSITCSVYDLDSATPATAVATPGVTISNAVKDTPVTANTIWTKDTVGYNFIHDLPASAFPVGGRRYAVEYKVTLTSGTVFHVVLSGVAQSILTS